MDIVQTLVDYGATVDLRIKVTIVWSRWNEVSFSTTVYMCRTFVFIVDWLIRMTKQTLIGLY